MEDIHKTREQLINELVEMRQRITALEALEPHHKATEKALLQSKEFSSSLLNFSPHPVIIINPDTSVKYVNPALEKLTGFSSTELIGKKPPYPWWAEEVVGQTARGFGEVMAGKKRKREELFKKKNGELFWAEITPAPVIHDGKLRYYLGNWFDITERKQAAEQLIRTNEQLRNLSTHLRSAREEERECIAREIHDELGQALTVLKMDISWLDKRLAKAPKLLREKIELMSTLLDTTLQIVRRISTELRPMLLEDLGLAAAIEWQTEEFQKRMGIRCKVSFSPENIILDRDCSVAVFRIFQEALTNICRHANATRVVVSLKARANEIVLTVSDNGKGITQEQLRDCKALGLIGMRERAYSLGGEVKINGVQDEGTTVTIRIPISKGEENNAENSHR